MSIPGGDPDGPVEALGEEQDTQIDPGGADPREPLTEVGIDQSQEIDPDVPRY